MPMQKEEAERALQLFWEFMGNARADDLGQQHVYKEVISALHVYLTDVLPASLPCLRARGTDGRVVEIQGEHNARPQTVDLYLNRGEKLGIVLDKVNLNGNWLSAGNQISPIMVSLITPGSAAAKDGRLARGDQLLEIDGHPLSLCSLERARWLMDRAERLRTTRLTVITSGLSEGLKHSVSRDFLDSRIIRQRRSKSLESLSRIPQTEVVVTAEVYEQERNKSLVYVPAPKPPKPNRQSSTRSSHSSSFRNHPAYAPSIGSRRDSNASLVSSTVETAAHLARTSFRRSEVMSGGFKKRKVRKMHIMKGESGLGLRIVGGKGSKFGDMGIFVNKLEEGGAAFNDNRLRPGDELLMVNGKSLVGLTHNEAVEVLKATQKLVQLVVATESTEGASVASSLQSIPEAVAARRAYYSPHQRSFSPLSVESSSTVSAVGGVGPELQQVPQRNTFFKETNAGGLELQLKTDASLHPTSVEGVEAETKFTSNDVKKEEPTSPMEMSDKFEVIRTVTPWARTTPHKATHLPESEVKTFVYAKTEGKSLGFSICGGKGSRQGDLGILVRNIDPHGLAAQDGRLHRGDEILDVNGKSLLDCTHKKAASIIRSMKTGIVTLTVRTGNGSLPRGNTIKRSPSEHTSSEFEVTLVKTAGKPLGLQLTDVKRDGRSSAVTIKKIAPNSPADACTDLKCSDQIIAVNTTNVANVKANKVRAFLSSLPPGPVKLTLLRAAGDTVQLPLDYQDSKNRSMAMGQANASSKAAANSEFPRVTVKATPVSTKDLEDISESEPESGGGEEEEGDDGTPEIPLAPPPLINGEMEMEGEADDDEMGPRLHMVISQARPSRPESVLMNIDGSLPAFEGHQGEAAAKHEGEGEEGFSMDSLPPSPPSPPASENSDWDENAPTVPTSAPPPIPDDSTLPLSEDDLHNGPPPIGDDFSRTGLTEQPPPALPVSKPPLISDYSTLDSDTGSLPPLLPDSNQPPPLLSTEASENVGGVPLTGRDAVISPPHGFLHLKIDLKKRATSGLGITVESSGPPTSDLFMIRRIMAVGAAAKDGRLKPGDRLVTVNGKNLAGLNHAAVLQELNSAPKDCHLIVWRDPLFETAAITPTFTGSRSSLGAVSDEEDREETRRFRSLSTHSLDKSPLSVAKKLSAGRGISPRGSPLAHNRLQVFTAAHLNGSPLSKRWSAESFPLTGPAGETLELSPPPFTSQLTPPSERRQRDDDDTEETKEFLNDNDKLPRGSPPTDTPPLPPSTPPTDTPPLPPGTPPIDMPPRPTDSPPLPPGTPPIDMPPRPTDSPPLPPGTPPTDTPALPPSTPPTDSSFRPQSTSPPHIPSAPPSTLVRGVNLNITELAKALGMESESEEDEYEAPPPIPQTTPTLTNKVHSTEADDEPLPSLPLTTPPSTKVDGEIKGLKEVERPKSLGPVPKGRRLDDAPFEIEVSKGLIGGLGMSVRENELGMIAVKALTNRSPITKDGNIRVGDHLISVNDENLLGKRLSEAEAIIKSLPRGLVRIVAMAPPRNVTNGGIKKSSPPAENSMKPTTTTSPSTDISLNSKSLASSISGAPSISPSGRQVVDEEGIVRVLLQRYGGLPLGFTIEGGCDTHLKYIYIQSLSVGSPASNCGLFNKGDQLVMIGENCLVGMTQQEAKRILETAPDSVEIVAQRKQSPRQIPKHSIPDKASRSHSGSESDIHNIQVYVNRAEDDPPPGVVMVPEETLTVQLFRTAGERLGLSIVGGTDNTDLPQVHVKKVLPDSVAGRNGRLKRGDRIISVNGNSIERVSNKFATEILKGAGDLVVLVVARKIGRRISTATTPYESRMTSRRGSGENTRQGSKGSSPKHPKRLVKMTTSSGENSKEGSRGQTPPTNPRRHTRRKSLGQSGEVLAFKERSTLPRKVGPKVGVRLVELHKGPTGLGMQIQGGKDRESPITVKMVISGGAAQKSGKIRPGDVILEANTISFESLTHAEAMKTLKGFPQGQVRLIIRDRTAVTHTTKTRTNF